MKYKPLLFTTTVRNPSRFKALLNVLSKFNKLKLTDELAEQIVGELIRYGLYRPTRGITTDIESKWGGKRITEASPIGIQLLEDGEVESLLRLNPQEHKEAGFARGWPSRFVTIYDLAKELGFVYFWKDEEIKFSELGSKLADSITLEIEEGTILYNDSHPELEQQTFLHAMAKYQRNNPFVSVKNENAPLILLLEVIEKLNSDTELNNVGISKLELPLIIYWKDNDSEKLYQKIKQIREEFGHTPSWETIIEICREEIMDGQDIVRDPKSIMVDYPDEFIRKMRLTGLITLRGGGRYIDINKFESSKVRYVLENYSNYTKFNTPQEYFAYTSKIDANLITEEGIQVTVEEQDKFLEKWVSVYDWTAIKEEMLKLASRSLSKDEVLKYLPSPVRLEFLTTLAIKSKFPQVKVVPNYPVDDEGIPTSTAGGVGNIGDIECYEDANIILVEVTMSEGRSQTMMEVWPISRHIEKLEEKSPNTICYFVAPSIFADSIKQINYVKHSENRNIYPKTIEDFLHHLEGTQALYV